MYSGQTNLSIDAKGRIAIPARYRQSLLERSAGRLVVSADLFNPCLAIHPHDEWQKVMQTLLSQPQSDPVVAKIRRLVVGQAEDAELDKQGRIGLTPALRERIKLGRSAVLVGQITKFELWTPEDWAAQEEDGNGVEITPEHMASLGL